MDRPVGSDPGSSEGRRPPRAGLPRPQPEQLVPMRTLSLANSPAVIPRLSWGANERITRPPLFASGLRFALVHYTAGSNRTKAQSAAIVRAIQLYHVRGNGWNDGLQLPRRQVRPGLRGPRGRGRQKRRRCARRGVQHRVSRVSRCSGTTPGPRSRGRTRRDCTAARLAPRPGARRPAVLAKCRCRESSVSYRLAGLPAAVSGHRDTGFTSCPGSVLYGLIPRIARGAASGGC